MNEKNRQAKCRMEASRNRMFLWTNTRGKFQTKDNRWIKYGIGPNGASDEIGFLEVEITQEMVGHKLPILSAIEMKIPGKDAVDNQQDFLDNMDRHNAVTGVAREPEDIPKIIRKWFTKFTN